MASNTISITPLTRNIGAEIGNIDLTKPISAEVENQLKNAIAQYQVIFFRDQKISHEQHMAVGQIFGDLIIHPGAKGIEGYDKIVAIHADKDSKYIAGDNWHSF